MVETGGLENRCARKGTGGSNPSLSAMYLEAADLKLPIRITALFLTPYFGSTRFRIFHPASELLALHCGPVRSSL